MQLSIRALAPFALFTLVQASHSKAPSGPSAVPVSIKDGSSALAQAKPAGITTAARPNNLTANAAQTDPDAHLYVCSDVNCGGTCVFFDLALWPAHDCVTVDNFAFASGYIEDGGAPLSYEVGRLSSLSHHLNWYLCHFIGSCEPRPRLYSGGSDPESRDVL
jgi:hypothetical protein